MMYGIVYVYRLSDFLDIAGDHGVTRIFLNSVWCKQDASEQGVDFFKWTEVHELSFMGAFGMGYKMLVRGETNVSKLADNNFLWTRIGLLRIHIDACCLRGGKNAPKTLVVTPGILVGTEIHSHALIPWSLFMENKIPKQVPVHEFIDVTPERS